MKKIIVILALLLVFPYLGATQMTIVKYVPKKVYVEPVFDYYENMMVEVVNDRVVKIVYQGKVTENQNESFAKALHRWEQEAWKLENFVVVADRVLGNWEKYQLVRPVYKPQPEDTNNVKKKWCDKIKAAFFEAAFL